MAARSVEAGPHKTILTSWRKLAFAAFVLAYYLYFCWDSLWVHFDSDDMMNLAAYWRLEPTQLLLSPLMIWRGDLRPLPGLVWVPALHWFGLNPVPYHVLILLVLMGYVYLVYRFAKVLGCGDLPAGLASLIVCYHAGLANLYYNTVFTYDVLCCFFYLSALVYYARIRASERLLSRGQMAAFLGLFLCAVDSKEMALTLPAVLLAYEGFYHGLPRWSWKAWAAWLRGPGQVLLLASVLDVVNLCGKFLGRHAIIHTAAYLPRFSMHRLWAYQIRSLGDLLYAWNYFRPFSVVVVYVILFYLAYRRVQGAPRPVLRFGWVFVMITPLPIEFLIGRGEACLAIPMVGWAVLGSMVFLDIARTVSDFLAGEPLFQHLGRRVLFGAMVIAGVFFWACETRRLKESDVRPVMARTGELTWNTIRQVQALNLHVRPHSTVAVLHDPCDGFDMEFILELCLLDRTVTVWQEKARPHTPEELAHADYVLDYRDGKLMRIR